MVPASQDLPSLLGRLAADIDDVIEAEIATALDAVEGRDVSLAGELKETTVPNLMGRIFSEGITGRLKVWQESIEKDIYFEGGLPVMAASTDTMDRMLAMLVREKVVSLPQKQEVEKIVDETGRKVGSVLVQLSLLRSDELLPAVRRHYESVILSLFSWKVGRWQIEPGMIAGPDRTRLLRHPAAIVREGLAAGSSAEAIAASLETGKNLFVLDTSGTAADVASHMLSEAAEAKVPSLFDGVRSLEEVARASGLPDAIVWQIAYALWCFRVLHPVRKVPHVKEGVRFDFRDLKIARERVWARFMLAKESDYVRFLGIDEQADAVEVRRAYQLILKEISPEMLGPELTHELKVPIRIIRDVLEESVRILCTPSLRTAYQQNALSSFRPQTESFLSRG